MNMLFFAALLLLMGIGLFLNAGETATSNAPGVRNDRVTAWLIKLGITHSPSDDQRIIRFNTWLYRLGGAAGAAFGFYLAIKTLRHFESISLPPREESGSLGWWLIFVALVAGIWGWRSRHTYERLIAIITIIYGAILLYHRYAAV